MEFALPNLLTELLSNGIWPPDGNAAMAQNLRSLVPPDRVRLFAVEEDVIFFNFPPFRTIADDLAAASPVVIEGFWAPYGALHEIDPARALILGDFGLGSDAPIILNYAIDQIDPPVFRLRWRDGRGTDWVQGARNFADFAALLGLPSSVA